MNVYVQVIHQGWGRYLMYKHIPNKTKCITDLYHIDQPDCFISIAILDTLHLLLCICVHQDY